MIKLAASGRVGLPGIAASLTRRVLQGIPSRSGHRAAAAKAARAATSDTAVTGFDGAVLDIPICDISPDESAREKVQMLGQHLARQDRWEELGRRMRNAEADRETTPGGMPVADLLNFGARADVVQAVEHMIEAGAQPGDPAAQDGVLALEDVLEDCPGDHCIALIVACTHIDIAWAWARATDTGTGAPTREDLFAAHIARASDILDPFDGIELDSPTIAATRCALLAGTANARSRVADDYEDLIDLDPVNHRHMRAMGSHLLPRWFGTYAQLELEARRTAARTADIWGDGGYAWVNFDAIAHDEVACARLDVEFFVDGLHDILERRPDQATANLLASYCGRVMAPHKTTNREAAEVRSEVHACAEWIVRDHLTEVHPMVWAHAGLGFDNAAPVPSVAHFAAEGRESALKTIARLFEDEIAAGRRIEFTANGPRIRA
ncbi:MAG: hypothetical protein NXH82_12450 [Rhodobacteraceae bacterium]|nr:hypothetical protein [Paracoccaceae bacterium]